MTTSADRERQQAQGEAPEPAHDDAAVKAAAWWVGQFARTLKTCRLYDPGNPAVLRFRAQLFESLKGVLTEHGEIALRFTSDDVMCDGVSIYRARSRDDNLAFPFFRDGVRGIAFQPGVTSAELDALIDTVVQVTGQTQAEDDLVTLLWQADLKHIMADHVPAEGDLSGPTGLDSGEVMPWPGAEAAAEEDAAAVPVAPEAGEEGRSDDWNVGDPTADLETSIAILQRDSQASLARFRMDYDLERETPAVTAALGLARAYLEAGTPEDAQEMGRFLPRVLKHAIGEGNWYGARDALELIRYCGNPEWSDASLAQELLQPISITSALQRLDRQDAAALAEFIALARSLGEPDVDLLNLVLAETTRQDHRQQLTAAVIDVCRENPERLAPWLSDPREAVVMSVIRMLGEIGGPSVLGLLRPLAHHPDPRVRQEVVSALRRVGSDEVRPLFLKMLSEADARTFPLLLQILGDRRDPAVARRMLEFVQDDTFERRPVEERRVIYMTLAAVGGDESVPDLESELHSGGWFSRGNDADRPSIARCLARIGTPLARAALERGAQSRRPAIRGACEDALASMSHE